MKLRAAELYNICWRQNDEKYLGTPIRDLELVMKSVKNLFIEFQVLT